MLDFFRNTDQVSKPEQDYRARIVKQCLLLLVMFTVLLISLLADIATGPATLGLGDIINGLFNSDELSTADSVIIWDIRLPYALMAVVVGFSLGLAGAEMQTTLNNPLASPFTLGVSAAAVFGASLAIVFNWNIFSIPGNALIPVFAFVFAFGSMLLVLALANFYAANVDTIILFGIALFFSFQALVAFVQFLGDADSVQQIVFWTLGSLARANWEKLTIITVVLCICFPWSLSQVWQLTLLRSGEDYAASLGVNLNRLRLASLLRVSLLTAVAVAFVGEIGFVGLVGPHIARMLVGEDHRFFLPASGLAGALLLSFSSIASKSLLPGVVLPVGIVTALVGVPLFMALIFRQGKRLR